MPASSHDLSPDEAARALQQMEQHRGAAVRDSGTHSRWVDVVAAFVVFALFAAPDFLGSAALTWTSWGYAVLAVGYVALLRTRRGSALLGQRARLDKRQISPRYRRGVRLVALAVMLASVLAILLGPDVSVHVPYLRTAVGALLAAVLIAFGRPLQQALLARAVRGGGLAGSTPGAAR